LLSYVEPSVAKILRSLTNEPELGAGEGRLKFRTLGRLARFIVPIMVRFIRNVIRPAQARARFDARIDEYLRSAHIAEAGDRFELVTNVTAFLREHLANAFPFLLPHFIPILGPGMGALNLLTKIGGDDASLALEITRGLPDNVTTQMDLALWQAAKQIRGDSEASAIFEGHSAEELSHQYLKGELPATAQSAVAHFMARYGMRGVGEIDIGRPRWHEDPTPVMKTLRSYMQIEPDKAPDVSFKRGEQAALSAVERLAAIARKQRAGWLKEKLVRAAARRIRLLLGTRESPKFFVVHMMDFVRRALLEAGDAFVEAGDLERSDDLFYLKIPELEALAAHQKSDWKSLIAERRLAYRYEQRRVQVPRVLVSDGRAFYEGMGSDTDAGELISGSPVSPGVVEGDVHVVFDPSQAQLAPGEILVCPGTDPAWTPLFLAAGGLVTEVGGVMTHGSVVAREYGIPAVVGVHQATSRLKSGQRIRVDGTRGEITLLSGDDNPPR
jgi:pyruvate,water dikinase